MARNQNQKKTGGQGKNQNRGRNSRQDGAQSPKSGSKSSKKDQEPKRPQDDWGDDEFDGKLPSYGSFLKDMQYEDNWGDDWDDDDTPIEKKVAAQKAEKAKAQKKKRQAKQADNRQKPEKKQPDKKVPEKLKPPVHEDEHLFHNEDDRGLTPEDIDLSAERRVQSAEILDKRKSDGKKQSQQKQSPQQQSPKQQPKDQAVPKQQPKDAAAKPASVVSETVKETVTMPAVEAISKGGGVSLRVVAAKSEMPPSNRRKIAERRAQNAETQVQSTEKSSDTQHKEQSAKPQPPKSQPTKPQSAKSQTQSPKKQDELKAKTPEVRKEPPAESKPKRDEPKKDRKKSKEPTLQSRASQGDTANIQPEASSLANSQLPTPNSKPQTPSQKRSVRAAIEPTDITSEVEGKDKPIVFGNLKLSKAMLASLKAANYHEPSPVQAGTIPDVLAGHDVMGQARTGTGKTAAFVIPILEGLDECVSGDEPVALILVPTRELAVQVRDEAEKLAKGRKVRTIACYGGKPIVQQIGKLKTGADIIVGTPGRILDLSRRGALKLDSLIWVVLDEADRMLDIGFRPDIERILKLTPADRQTLLFSATLPPDVVKLAERYMRNPKVIDFSDKQMAVETIDQYYITIDRDRKLEGLICLINEQQPKQAIVFCRTKRGADRVKRQLEGTFASLDSLHGDMAQGIRDRVMAQFRAGKLQILVATDVVGRGIDVTGISHIINYDIPVFCDDYVHRVGRTGRMGREGTAYTFVTAEEGQELTRIEMRINQQLQRAELKDFEAVSQIVPQNKEPSQPVFGKPPRRVRRAL